MGRAATTSKPGLAPARGTPERVARALGSHTGAVIAAELTRADADIEYKTASTTAELPPKALAP
jgi:hypothetical protein